MRQFLWCALACAMIAGCGDDSEDNNAMAASDMATPTTPMTTPTTTPPLDQGPGPVEEDMGTTSDMPASQDMPALSQEPPTTGDELFVWLQAEVYKSWEAESAVHPSTGPHGSVRTFINATLATSLADDNPMHPVGAAAVKELYTSTGTLRGWAVEIKTEADSQAGNGWYWYEVFSTTDGSNPVVDGNGVGLCTGCHATDSKDFVLTPYPLN